jgi:hypothetical protein
MNEISINESNINNSDNNKSEENFYYFKLVYIIATSIIGFLGILILIENSNIIFSSSQNKTENLVLFYIIYCSFSWLIVYLFSLIIYKIFQFILKNNKKETEEEDELELKYITNQNIILNKSNYSNEDMIVNNFENKNYELKKFDQDKSASINNINNFALSGNVKNCRLKANLMINTENLPSNNDLENNNRGNFVSNNVNTFSNYKKNPANKLKLIYMVLMLLNYSVFMILGIFVIIKLLKEEVFKNYKLHYKIYLFALLSLIKSVLIVIGFIYKFVSRKIESNSVKFELNEEFLHQIEREIQEANRISGIISPDRNLIKYNHMFNRQDFNKNSNFALNKSASNNNLELNIGKKLTENLIDKEKELNIVVKNQHENINFNDIHDKNNGEIYKARNIFNFKIKEKVEGINDNNINNSLKHHKKIKIKNNSDYNFNLNKDSFDANSIKNNQEEEEKDVNKYKKSFSNKFNSKQNILIQDYNLINSKIDSEKLEPSNLIF